MEQGPAVDKPKALKAEIARLKAKLSQTEDKDIREALKLKIETNEAELEQLTPAEPEAETVPEAPPEPSTPEQVAEAERLIKLANVEKIRGNKPRALELMKEAAAAAPGSPLVLETLGDDYAERKLFKEARECYRKALQLDPKNLALDKKHAMLVFRSQNVGSFEDQMRSGMLDSPFINRQEALANSKAAVVYAVFLPGLAQIVVGETVAGITLLAGWVGCLFWIFLLRDDLAGLMRFTFGKSGHGASMGVLFPMLIAAIIYISSLSMAAARVKRQPRKKSIDRPTPPMDLPFE